MTRSFLLALILSTSAFAQVDAGALHERIEAVCPIDGVSIGDPANKGTWRIDYRPEATAAQRSAAQSIIATWSAADDAETARDRLLRGEYRDVLQELAAIRIALELHPGVPRLVRRRNALIAREQELWSIVNP